MAGDTVLTMDTPSHRGLRRRRQRQTTSELDAKKTFMNHNYSSTDSMVLEDETPRPESTTLVTGEEQCPSNVASSDDAAGPKPLGSFVADGSDKRRKGSCFRLKHKIGTWNVRSMYQGKLDIVKNEMERTGIEILGISELKWIGLGHFDSGNQVIYYSGHQTHRKNGVAIIVGNKISKFILGYNPVNDRIISLRLQGHPVNVTIIQVYAPTSDATEEEREEFYGQLQETIDATAKKDCLIILGDWNAKVGAKEEPKITGRFGLGTRNEPGEKLLEFCETNKLFIANTMFQQHKRRLYTWTSPSGQYKNQIDYIIGNRRWKSAFQSAKTLPGADCGSDHELLVTTFKIKLKVANKLKNQPLYNLNNISDNFRIKVRNRFSMLEITDQGPEELWNEIKNVIAEEAKQQVPKLKRKKQSRWLSEEAIKIAEERRKMKAIGNLQEVRRKNAEFQRQARRDKEKYLNEQCKKIEENNALGRTRDLFKTIRGVTGKFTAKVAVLNSPSGRKLTEEGEIKTRWKEYTEDLYKRDPRMGSYFEKIEFDREPQVTEDEVRLALEHLANNKAPGNDKIQIELFKAVGDEGVKALTALCQKIWTEITWPKDWKHSVFITIPKKGDPRECANHRTIALISHASKVMLKIIQKRLEPFMEREMPLEQAGFRHGRGTRDQICNLRWLMESAREYQKDLFLCFLDYSKAFDCVDHDKLWNVLREMGVPEHLTLLIKELYNHQTATVRTHLGNTEEFTVEKGVRQGCLLSPYLFNLYSEHIMRTAGLADDEAGVRISGRKINNLRYADDTTLIAENAADLQRLIKKVKEASENAGLSLNIKKTKVMTTCMPSSSGLFQIDNELVEMVDSYSLLGSLIDREGHCTQEVKRRLMLGRTAMVKLNSIMKDKDVSVRTKIRMVKAMVFPVVTYGCESWTMRKAERQKVDAFELWTWRRLLRIPWTAKKTNQEVLNQIKPDHSLEALMTKLKLSYFGHVMRGDKSLEKEILLGKVEGSRKRGRPRIRWLDTIKEITGQKLAELKEMVWNRALWRARVQEVTRSRKRLDGT